MKSKDDSSYKHSGYQGLTPGLEHSGYEMNLEHPVTSNTTEMLQKWLEHKKQLEGAPTGQIWNWKPKPKQIKKDNKEL